MPSNKELAETDFGINSEQFTKLRKIVNFTYGKSRFYTELWDSGGFHPSFLSGPKDICLIPTVSRTQLRDYSAELSEGLYNRGNISRLHNQTTSGSSGIPLRIYWTNIEWFSRIKYLLYAYRKQGLRYFSNTHNLSDPVDIKKPLFFQRAGILKNTYYNIYDDFSEIIQTLSEEGGIDILKGMPSDLFSLAYYVNKKSQDFPKIGMIQSGGEVLDESTKTFVETTFKSKIFDSYSSVETGLLAFQTLTSGGRYAVSSNNSILECKKLPGIPDNDFETVVTNLNNFTTPIIRYRSGDIVKVNDAPKKDVFAPRLIDSIYGKYLDFLVHPNGNLISAHVVKQNLTHLSGIDRFQVEQISKDQVIVKIQPSDSFSNRTKKEISELMRRDLGSEIVVDIVVVTDLVTKSDYRKFKIVSSLPAQEILDSK